MIRITFIHILAIFWIVRSLHGVNKQWFDLKKMGAVGSISCTFLQFNAFMSKQEGNDTNQVCTDKPVYSPLLSVLVYSRNKPITWRLTPCLRWTHIFSIKITLHALHWPTSICVYKTMPEESCSLQGKARDGKFKQPAWGPEDAWTFRHLSEE